MACRIVKYVFLGLAFALWISCKSKKVSLADNELVDIHDFIEYFQIIPLPCQFSDTILARHSTDTAAIGFQTFLRFVPDSVITKSFGKFVRPKLYPVGKAGGGKNETYIFIKAITPQKRLLYVLCFDKENKFAAAKSLNSEEGDSKANIIASLDSKFTLTVLRQRKAEGQVFYKKEAYVFNDAGNFTLILTESNEAKPEASSVYNPIDTLPHKHKFTGDYVQDKRNFISVRDGRDNSKFLFFVHFEKEEGKCKGELKGEAKFVSANAAHFKTNGDPCMIEFLFSGSFVKIRELEGCGNHRDIKCYFEGSFEKKKYQKSKTSKKKTA
ncbi:MAG: hypothetical protein ACHQEM_05530 [Chitinophagales bacterium]